MRTNSLDANFNAFVYLAYRNDESGVVGVAYKGSTCARDPQMRSSINEYTENDLATGQVSQSILSLSQE